MCERVKDSKGVVKSSYQATYSVDGGEEARSGENQSDDEVNGRRICKKKLICQDWLLVMKLTMRLGKLGLEA